jgi:hypothetical protein
MKRKNEVREDKCSKDGIGREKMSNDIYSVEKSSKKPKFEDNEVFSESRSLM